MFEGQARHLVLLGILLTVVALMADQTVLAGQWAGRSTSFWLAAAIAAPILHQVYVWLSWRLELHHQWLSQSLGRERGFLVYAVGFSVLFVFRLLSIVALSLASRNSFEIRPAIAAILSLALLLPSVYLVYSVLRYFGLRRAFGIDHFDPSYRKAPFVREGIFRFSSNAMYVFGFLLLWIPGVLLSSKAGLLAAFFSHVYIWVHYYCTELPDMWRIYGRIPMSPGPDAG